MIRIKTILLAMLMSMMGIETFAYDAYVDDIYYDLSETQATVTYLSFNTNQMVAYSGSVVIPESVTYKGNTYAVTAIGNYAFSTCSGLTSVTIPNSVTSVGVFAFSHCVSLTEVTIPNSVTSIGSNAFWNCRGLTSITIPNSVTSIGGDAFWNTAWYNSLPDGLVYAGSVAYKFKGKMPANTSIDIKEGTKGIAEGAFFSCYGLQSVSIPNSVTYIGNRAFKDCSGLTSVTIPNSVTSIEAYAFQGCSLTSVAVPHSITSISNGVFYGCSSLASITIPNTITSIGRDAFYGTAWYDSQPDGVVYAGEVAYKYKGKMPAYTTIDIKEGTKSITESAFSGCSGLVSINIPRSVQTIGNSAFQDCSSLVAVTVPDGVTAINANVFYECTSLSFISIPNTVRSIGYNAFQDCSMLTSIEIPSSVNTIGSAAFYGCSGLASISIPDGVRTLESDLLRDCICLTSIEIPNSVTSIENSAFMDCTGLTSVHFGSGLKSVGCAAFSGCSGLSSINLPNSVTTIGEDAFWGTLWFTKQPDGLVYAGNVFYEYKQYKDVMPENTKLVLKKGTLGIAGGAFRNAWDRLVSIVIPESVVCIGERAFGECRGLTSITIPQNVESIGMMAFYNCTNLDSVITKIKEPYEIDGTIFSVFDEETISDLFTSSTLYVPKGTKDKYAKTYCWNKFREVVEIEIAEESNDTLSASDLQTLAGTKVVLPIELKNEDEVKLCQYDLHLPEGVTVATKSNGKLDVKLTERAETHSVSSTRLSNGDYRFVIASLDNDSFTGNEGTLMEITLDVPETMEAGEYTVKVMNVELSVPDGNDLMVVRPADTESKLTVKSYTPGDVNNDGSVSVTDVGCAINYILEQVPSVFIFEAADMNGDKSVSVTDVGMIINLILNEGAASRRTEQMTMEDAQLSLMPVADGYELLLEDKDAFIGFQFDVELEEGATISDMQLDSDSDHVLTCRKLSNGKWRVVCYSPTNSLFNSNKGDCLLTINTEHTISLGDIRLTTAGFNELRPASIVGTPTDIASIEQGMKMNVEGGKLCINSDRDTTLRLYSLGGSTYRTLQVRKVRNSFDGLRKGIYMINNQKVIVR